MKFKVLLRMILAPFFLVGCTSLPEGLEPVTGFEAQRYLGKWYEIVRLDHSFEGNLGFRAQPSLSLDFVPGKAFGGKSSKRVERQGKGGNKS